DGVVTAVAGVERVAADRQRVRHRAEDAPLVPANRDRPFDGRGRQIDDAHRVAHGVGDVDLLAADGERARVDADGDVPGRAVGEIDEADGPRRRGAALVYEHLHDVALGGPLAGP